MQGKKLDRCGCCEGIKALTPVPIENPPGLRVVAYRVGTHASFKETMISALSGKPALRNLTTRDNDDPAIGLCDAWASVLDVLAFYQERIANEGYLRTATERRSILEMARSIGYELCPGVAAGTFLAFLLETAKGAPSSAKIDIGSKVQSVPGQDEMPQIFETVEEIVAKSELNELKPKMNETRLPVFGDTHMYLKGITTDLKLGDPILIVGEKREKDIDNENWEFRRIQELKTDEMNDRTYISWEKPLGNRMPRKTPPSVGPKVYALRLRAAIFGHNAPDWDSLPIALRIGERHPGTGILIAGPFTNKDDWVDEEFEKNTVLINLGAVYSQIVFNSWIVLSSPGYQAELYRVKEVDEETKSDYNITAKTTRLRISGEHIEKFSPRTATVFGQSEEIEQADWPIASPIFGNRIDLDRKINGMEQGRILIINGHLLKSVEVAERMWSYWKWNWEEVYAKPPLYLISADGSNQKELKSGDVLDVVGLPEKVDTSGSIKWHLTDKDGFTGFIIAESDAFMPEKKKTKEAIGVQLKSVDEEDEIVSEVVTLEKTETNGNFSTLVLNTSLQNVYHRDSVTINANVVRATHGETKTEVLGSGDGSLKFQKFDLKQKPLTYVSSSTPSGTLTTLEIRVNDILWKEVPTFFGHGPDERIFVTRTEDDGKTVVIFGDGVTGARLPTGQENVKAKYRIGIGLPGLLKANQLSQLITRPLGVREVSNPISPKGADNPEERDNARKNAPLTVLTLDRIVSLQDFEDFSGAFAGIGKAQASLLWSGDRKIVHITVAAADGGPVDETSDLFKNLIAGIDKARHTDKDVRVDSYNSLKFDVKAKVKVDKDYIAEDVLAAASEALQKAFSFEARDFGQPVAPSDVLTVIQRVEGVTAVDLDELNGVNPFEQSYFRLPADVAHWDDAHENIVPAELITINPNNIVLMEMTK